MGRAPHKADGILPPLVRLVALVRVTVTTSEKVAADIYRDVMQTLDTAEELGGPDVPEYVELMRAVAAEALRRAESAEG